MYHHYHKFDSIIMNLTEKLTLATVSWFNTNNVRAFRDPFLTLFNAVHILMSGVAHASNITSLRKNSTSSYLVLIDGFLVINAHVCVCVCVCVGGGGVMKTIITKRGDYKHLSTYHYERGTLLVCS
jgi:hypothetical protein